MLFVPANRPKFVHSAHERGADAIILDLEDSVPVAEKASAREALKEASRMVGRNGADVFIRVNKPFEIAIYDLDAAIEAKPAGVVFPKVETADEVKILNALVAEREIRGGIPAGTLEFMLLIESAAGLEQVSEIASCCSRTGTLSLGMEDLSKELEIDLTRPGTDLSWAHARIVMSARAHGLFPFGLVGSLANFSDAEAFRSLVAASRQFGYVGASCIHPAQVSILNEGFAPSAEEVTEAKAVIAAYEEAERNGTAAASLNGRMIDVPIVERARQLLRRASREN